METLVDLQPGVMEKEISIEQERSEVIAFDLALEWQRIHEPMVQGQNLSSALVSRKIRFFENAWTYAKETAGVQVASYPPYIMVRENGTITLHADGYDGPVREIYNPDSNDPNLVWPEYRLQGVNYLRAKLEYETFADFEMSKELQQAQEGDMFIWISMVPTDILLSDLYPEEKKRQLRKLGYGFETHTFVLTVEDGVLQGRVIQNYLHPIEQRELIKIVHGEDLFGDVPGHLELLSKIVNVRNQTIKSTENVRRLIEELYEHTPKERKKKVAPPRGDLGRERWRREQEIEAILRQTQPMLENVFYLLYHSDRYDLSNDSIRELIERRLRGWENAVAALRNGEEKVIEGITFLTSVELEQLAIQELAEIRRRERLLLDSGGIYYDWRIEMDDGFVEASIELEEYAAIPYIAQAGMCGSGSGFSDNGKSSERTYHQQKSGDLLSIAMTHQSASGREIKRCVLCRFCGQSVDAIVKNGTITCMECGASAPYPPIQG